MSIHKEIQTYMQGHSAVVNAIGLAITGSMGTLVHSEYLRCMQQKQIPVHKILVPELEQVDDYFVGDTLKEWLANDYIDLLFQDPTFCAIREAQQPFQFFSDCPEILKTVFELQVVPGIKETILNHIRVQFDLKNTSSVYQESPDLDIFNGCHGFTQDQQEFVVHQSVLQLISIMGKAEREWPENNEKIHLTDDEILIVRNANAFGLSCFDTEIIQSPICKTLSFVSSTIFSDVSSGENCAEKHGDRVHWCVQTSPFNDVVVVLPAV